MKKVLIIVGSILIVFVTGYLLDSSSIPEISEEGATEVVSSSVIDLPEFSFNDLKGKDHSIASLKGKIVILNFWASWCGPCKEEFPEMLEIVNSNKDVVLVAISNDEEKKDIVKFIKSLKKEGTNLLQENVFVGHDKDKGISSELFNVLRLPETFIINKDQKIVKKVIGSFLWTNKDMSKFISELSLK